MSSRKASGEMMRIKESVNNKIKPETKSFRNILHDMFRKSNIGADNQDSYNQNMLEAINKIVDNNKELVDNLQENKLDLLKKSDTELEAYGLDKKEIDHINYLKSINTVFSQKIDKNGSNDPQDDQKQNIVPKDTDENDVNQQNLLKKLLSGLNVNGKPVQRNQDISKFSSLNYDLTKSSNQNLQNLDTSKKNT